MESGRKKHKYKIVYNNYQFYENAALIECLEKQMAEGYILCRMLGDFGKILIFRYASDEIPKSFVVYRKHLDEQTDKKIETMISGGAEVICQSNLYIIFGITRRNTNQVKSEVPEKKKNRLLGISVKKTAVLIVVLVLLLAMGLGLRIFLLENGNLYFNILRFIFCIALSINFLLYFIGDLYDIKVGKGSIEEGIIYFSGRTKVKDFLFRVGDILRWIIFIGMVCGSAWIIWMLKDLTMGIHILGIWLLYGGCGFIYRIRFQQSYISQLVIAVLVATLSF